MTEQDLRKANKLSKEISELAYFILIAQSVWDGKLIKKSEYYIFKSSSFGMHTEGEYFMNTDIKNKVLDVLRDHLKDLENQLEKIGKER